MFGFDSGVGLAEGLVPVLWVGENLGVTIRHLVMVVLGPRPSKLSSVFSRAPKSGQFHLQCYHGLKSKGC